MNIESPKDTVTERGILFRDEMIRAYLDGRKTMTRRIKGLDKINVNPDFYELHKIDHRAAYFLAKDGRLLLVKFPYGSAGDTLYFKEAWKMWKREDGRDFIHYRADNAKVCPPDWWTKEDWNKINSSYFDKWRSSLFIPRKFSRFRHVPILSVRVQRLHEITAEDAWAEGVDPTGMFDVHPSVNLIGGSILVDRFARLWDEINKDKGHGWEKNDWVFVYMFKRWESNQ